MSIDRTDRVYLPADEPRCVPQGICLQASACARRLAAVLRGCSMIGSGMPALPHWCAFFLPIERRAQTLEKRQSKRHWDAADE